MESSSSSSSSDYVELIRPPLPVKSSECNEKTTHKDKTLSPSSSRSSSADSPLDEPFHEGGDRLSTSSSTSSSSSDHITLTSIIKPPPSQVMEIVPNNDNPKPNIQPYRIPPHVFERNPSTAPMEWSVASNESLFSIPGSDSMTSFKMNESFWQHSGEFNVGGEANTSLGNLSSSRMFSYSKPNDKSCTRSRELGIAEATMKEMIKESEVHSCQKPKNEVHAPRRSHGSNASNKSFAFSIMGDSEKARTPSSVRSGHEQQMECDQFQTVTENHEPTCPKLSTLASTEGNNNNNDDNLLLKWFSCFNCCKLC